MMVFFLDRNTSPKLVHVLGMRGFTALHHNDEFDENTPDPTIIEFVARRQLVLVTFDRRIWSEHRESLVAYSPSIIFLPKSVQDSGIAGQSQWFTLDWPKVITKFEELEQPAIVRVSLDCRIEKMQLQPTDPDQETTTN
jgi:predicted nuclease of predicted toxin-antitoxin system